MTKTSSTAILVALVTGVLYLLYAPAVAVDNEVHSTDRVRPAQTPVDRVQGMRLQDLSARMRVGDPVVVRPSELTSISMSWSAAGGGGMIGGSGNASFGGLVGQSVIGRGTSVGAELGAGFWTGTKSCACDHQGDGNADGQIDPVDLNMIIDALFFAGANPKDALCPYARLDVNCDASPDAVDLNYVIDIMFFAGPSPCNPCTN